MAWVITLPSTIAVGFLALEGLDHLHDVGGEVLVGDLDAAGDARRSRRVLQVGDGVLKDDGVVVPGCTDLVRNRVDRDDAGTLLGRTAAEELAHALGSLGGGQDRRGLAVVEHGVQAADVAGLGRVEQWHRDPSGVQGAEEGDEVFEVLRAQDCDPVAGFGHLLQARTKNALFLLDEPSTGLHLHDVAILLKNLRALTAALRDLAGRDVAILIDQEGGRVARLGPPHWPAYPPGAAYGRLYDRDAGRGLQAARLEADEDLKAEAEGDGRFCRQGGAELLVRLGGVLQIEVLAFLHQRAHPVRLAARGAGVAHARDHFNPQRTKSCDGLDSDEHQYRGLRKLMREPRLTAAPSADMQIAPVPRISIQAFCETQASASAINRAAMDRRMNKTHLKVNMGGASAAIEAYRNAPTPNLIVLEGNGDRALLLSQLEELSEFCDPGTKVVIIGPSNDIELYRELIALGVSDYMHAPVDVIAFVASVSKAFSAAKGKSLGKVTAVLGAKGGVGASTIAHNVAWGIAIQYAAPVVLVDFDPAFGTSGLNFNQDPPMNLGDVLSVGERLDAGGLDKILFK